MLLAVHDVTRRCIMNSFLHFSSAQIYFFIYAVCHMIDNCIVSFFFSRILLPRPTIKHPFLWSLPFALIPLIYKIVTGELHSATHNLFFFASVLLPCLVLYRDPLFYRLGSFLFVWEYFIIWGSMIFIFLLNCSLFILLPAMIISDWLLLLFLLLFFRQY